MPVWMSPTLLAGAFGHPCENGAGKAAMTMYPPERQRAITDLLIQHDGRRATVTQISEQLRVTTETVRRDLDVLERRGVLRRIRGGAELLDSTPFEQALAARHAEQYEDKLVIARRVELGQFRSAGGDRAHSTGRSGGVRDDFTG